MSKLKIKDIPHLDSITSNPTGGFKRNISFDKEFGIDKPYFSTKGKVAFGAKIEKNAYDYAYLYGTVTAIGKYPSTQLEGGVSVS
jgi:hypothetical protein